GESRRIKADHTDRARRPTTQAGPTRVRKGSVVLVLARSLVSAEPSPHDEGFKGKRKGCKRWGRSQPWTSKHHRSRTWCRPRARTTHLPSRGSDLLHHLHPFFRFFRNFRETQRGKANESRPTIVRQAGRAECYAHEDAGKAGHNGQSPDNKVKCTFMCKSALWVMLICVRQSAESGLGP